MDVVKSSLHEIASDFVECSNSLGRLVPHEVLTVHFTGSGLGYDRPHSIVLSIVLFDSIAHVKMKLNHVIE